MKAKIIRINRDVVIYYPVTQGSDAMIYNSIMVDGQTHIKFMKGGDKSVGPV